MTYIPNINLDQYLIEEDLISLIPGAIVRKYGVMPVFRIGETITLALLNPKKPVMVATLQEELKMEVDFVYADTESIHKAIQYYYGDEPILDGLLSGGIKANQPNKKLDTPQDLKSVLSVSSPIGDDSPIVNLVNSVINEAILKRASDIHIEPAEEETLVRIRIDGVMHETKKVPSEHHLPIASRIKIMASLDIAESRIPQDGKIQIEANDKVYELRISTLPTLHGENIVIRILDKSSLHYSLEKLGLSELQMSQMQHLIHQPYGMILATGPTGSGKTSSLYTILNTINTIAKNIITLEDPVEYQIPLIRQVQVNRKAGLTFSSGLRSILRQDPDIIMVGEIRDLETAELAIRSSLTGHVVYSTLHTNDAPGAVRRLVDMGVEPFLVASSVTGIIAQRLIRKICSSCKESYSPKSDVTELLGIDKKVPLFKGKGCKECSQSGFLGRVGIFEMLVVNETIKEAITQKATLQEIRDLAIKNGMKLLRESAIEKVISGVTTPEEALSTTQMIM